ncbi:unnamed protein product [Rhizoctonia solani]|uniref:Protein kinase domain-containing protein n=1 Tax=Rhizoctonia solani TaxID=456999 RepID=A0A8H3DCF5_9AGAM|nr:unnamed protein product [Rhizoctonia solani]
MTTKYLQQETEDPESILYSESNDDEHQQRSLHRSYPPVKEVKAIANNRRAVTTVSEPLLISSSMPLQEIGRILGNHSCPDITQGLDLEKCSTLPVRGGGFGDVYEGLLISGQKVAIKSARIFVSSREGFAQTTKSLARELYSWSKCKHPNVLELYGLAYFNNQIATVSPWMDNGTLPQYINQHAQSDVRNLCYQISGSVAYLHGMGVVHGDIKGANVLIADDGTPKLADFGNTILRAYSLRFTGTLDEASFSVRWTAPELLSGATNVSIEADIYALGMTILEAFTGEVPFSDKSESAVLGDVMLRRKIPTRREAYFPSDDAQKETLWRLLERCWDSRPRERPSAKDVQDHLNSL